MPLPAAASVCRAPERVFSCIRQPLHACRRLHLWSLSRGKPVRTSRVPGLHVTAQVRVACFLWAESAELQIYD